MKRLVLPALLALASTGCMHAQAPLVPEPDEAGKCELIQTLMREQLPQRLLQGLVEDGHSSPTQVLVFVRKPDDAVLERLFAGDPSCEGPAFKVVREITGESLVLFLQPQGDGYVYDAQRASPERMSLGGEAKGAVRKREGVWAASSI
ncbi:hypothetical protein [Melittangium boletus]|uniref:Lipoprotein n=1 Tax=Melittangium boletus DSM 14713 TaxID=1294270 RepID=A0A250IMQ5_9BACT|nr:hypothetical protein [Melittangium boletus]ATB32530.1 hypothetical protein MEBOL_006010 [Melittangium boletus DSM 14713]